MFNPSILAAALHLTGYSTRWPIPTPAILASILGLDSAAFQTLTEAALPALATMSTPPRWLGHPVPAGDAFNHLRGDAIPNEAAPHLLAGLILGAVQRQPRDGFSPLPATLSESDEADLQVAVHALGLRVPQGGYRCQLRAFATIFGLDGDDLDLALLSLASMPDLRGVLSDAPESTQAWAVLAGVWLAREHWQASLLPMPKAAQVPNLSTSGAFPDD